MEMASIILNIILILILCFILNKRSKKKVINKDTFESTLKIIEHYENIIYTMIFSENLIFHVLKKNEPDEKELNEVKKEYIKLFLKYVPKEILSEMIFYFNDEKNLIRLLITRIEMRLKKEIFDNMMNGDKIIKGIM